jgi:hypothetical protein
MAVDFLPSQIGTEESIPLPYTGSPIQLLWGDAILFFRSVRFLLGIVLPWKPWASGTLDELFPSPPNLLAITVHTFLIVYQLGFLLSLPYCLVCPILMIALYVSAVIFGNNLICRVLNGSRRFLESQVSINSLPEHEEEHWIFINGVAVG